MDPIVLKVIPHCSDQQRFYCPPKTLVFIPINRSTPIPHEKPSLTTCTLIPLHSPPPPPKKNKGKKLASYQLWCQNLWLWTKALHTSYRHLTLSLTTANSWIFVDWGHMPGRRSSKTEPRLVYPIAKLLKTTWVH